QRYVVDQIRIEALVAKAEQPNMRTVAVLGIAYLEPGDEIGELAFVVLIAVTKVEQLVPPGVRCACRVVTLGSTHLVRDRDRSCELRLVIAGQERHPATILVR